MPARYQTRLVEEEIFEDQWGKYKLYTLPGGKLEVQPIFQEGILHPLTQPELSA